MKVKQTVCDVCGAVKGITNHWFKASVVRGSEINPNTSSVPAYDMPPTFFLAHARFDRSLDVGKDICGQECATKLLQHWMATGTLETPATKDLVPA